MFFVILQQLEKEKTKMLVQKLGTGYCPLSMRQGAGQGAQARRRAGRWHAEHGRSSAGAASARQERARHGRWARGLARAVHSVHSAYFWTRFDLVLFLSH